MDHTKQQRDIRRLFDAGRTLEDGIEAIRENLLAGRTDALAADTAAMRRRALDLAAGLLTFEKALQGEPPRDLSEIEITIKHDAHPWPYYRIWQAGNGGVVLATVGRDHTITERTALETCEDAIQAATDALHARAGHASA